MKIKDFNSIFMKTHPDGEVVSTKLNMYVPTYKNRTWQVSITDEDKVSIRLINDTDPENFIVQEMFLSKEAFWQLRFLLGIIEEHLELDEASIVSWLENIDTVTNEEQET